jgi:chemotaxis protein MotB
MRRRAFHEDLSNFWPPWADVLLIILLMLILYIFMQFISYSSASIDELLVVKKRQSQMEEEILREFEKDYKNDIMINRDGSLQKITFSDKILFDLGKAELKEQGRMVLLRMARILNKNQFYKSIQIEGHTDNLPITGILRSRYPSNWELSSARATSVVRYMQDHAGLEPWFLSATGYSEYHPVVENTDKESRGLNRRIELILVYTTSKDKKEGN